MADITKCTGLKKDEHGIITCPFRKNCYRFTAPDNPKWQSWFADTPLKWAPGDVPTCEYLMS